MNLAENITNKLGQDNRKASKKEARRQVKDVPLAGSIVEPCSHRTAGCHLRERYNKVHYRVTSSAEGVYPHLNHKHAKENASLRGLDVPALNGVRCVQC